MHTSTVYVYIYHVSCASSFKHRRKVVIMLHTKS